MPTKNTICLNPLKTSIKQKPLWGFDIETYSDKNKFLMGSIVGDFNINKTFWNKEEFIDFLKQKARLFGHGYIFATNLNFDAMALFDKSSLFNKITPIIKNSQMLCTGIDLGKNKKLKFVDSWNFAKISVKKMGEMINIHKLNHPEFLGEKISDYYKKIILEEYNLRDSEITYKFMKFLQNGFNDLGCNLKLTLASTSMDLFRRRFLKKKLYQPERNILNYSYNAYYGGRTEVIKRGKIRNINYYDVNSLYPSVMVNDYPDPNSIKFSKTIKKETIYKYEGIAKVNITTPEYMYIPYLPCRYEINKQNKLIFPLGTFTGYYTFFELRKALKLGYRINKFYNGILYINKFKPFIDYVNTLYDMRKEYKKANDYREYITKIMLNSLYGKFAQKIDTKEIIIHVDRMTEEKIKAAVKISRSGDFFILNKPYKRVPIFVNPIFSIYTTAYARDKLYDYMQKYNEHKTYYYDTDSLFTKAELPTSNKLGSMKKEFTIKKGILVKPKMYLMDEYVKCKGCFKMDKDGFLDLLISKKFKMTKFVKFKEANRRKLEYNQVIELEKSLDLEDNKRAWQDKFNPDTIQDSVPISL